MHIYLTSTLVGTMECQKKRNSVPFILASYKQNVWEAIQDAYMVGDERGYKNPQPIHSSFHPLSQMDFLKT
ncbi:hypothetical protein P8452_32695 [Trifolium repens]|nr:hypothetical protein P8452_32695 [Trifolium repens]